MSTSLPTRRNRGLTLIELIMFILIVSVGLVGLLSVINLAVSHSADPMVRKQMLAIAESLLEEVEMQPFTYCDPTDANAITATSTAGCATTIQGLGPGGTGQTRTGSPQFNNVPDYWVAAGFSLPTVSDISGNKSYAGYSATITIATSDALGPAGLTITPNDATAANLNLLRISVTVNRNGSSDSLTLEGYRARHSPNNVP